MNRKCNETHQNVNIFDGADVLHTYWIVFVMTADSRGQMKREEKNKEVKRIQMKMQEKKIEKELCINRLPHLGSQKNTITRYLSV